MLGYIGPEYAVAKELQISKLLFLIIHFVWMDNAYGIITFNMLASIYSTS